MFACENWWLSLSITGDWRQSLTQTSIITEPWLKLLHELGFFAEIIELKIRGISGDWAWAKGKRTRLTTLSRDRSGIASAQRMLLIVLCTALQAAFKTYNRWLTGSNVWNKFLCVYRDALCNGFGIITCKVILWYWAKNINSNLLISCTLALYCTKTSQVLTCK